MANITVTIPDSVVPRLQAALGVSGVPATNAQVQAAIKQWLQRRVAQYETRAVATAKKDEIEDEVW